MNGESSALRGHKNAKLFLNKHFALYRVREPYLPFAFSIKLEVSTRPEAFEQERDFSLHLLTSPVTPISALTQVATLERMWTDKKAAVASRHHPRDLYDLWFIAQRLGRRFEPDLSNFALVKE